MAKTPSFQDLLNSFADEVFVGRGEQLTLFESALEASQPPFLILNISGQGGVGKTTLIERYCQISKNKGIAQAVVNEDHLTIPKILESFVNQLQKDGLDFDTFTERYKKYLELKEQVESDPKVPSGLMDFAIRGITKVGVKSLKRVPLAGDVADVFLSESEEVLAEQASAFTSYIIQKFSKKDDRILLLDTDAELSKYFLEDITKSLKGKKAVISFDTYEKTSGIIEKWLINLLLGGYGEFSSNLLFVIAGRYSLGQNWTRFRKAIRQIELKEFTEDEAKDYLIRSGITDEKLISQFIEITERLPVLLALLVSSPNQLPHDVSGDAVQRFLQGLTPEQQEAALISSLPRYFNSDVLSSILGDGEGKNTFVWLSKSHFVKASETGWVYHDVVRFMMFKYLRLRSHQQFSDIHKRLEEYYQKQINNLGFDLSNERIHDLSSNLEKEKVYHFLWQKPLKNIEVIVKSYFTKYWELVKADIEKFESEVEDTNFNALRFVYSGALSQLSNEILDLMPKDQLDNLKNLSMIFSEETLDFDKSFFEWLIKTYNLSNDEKSAVHYFVLISKIDDVNKDLNLALSNANSIVQLNSSLPLSYFLRAFVYYEMKEYKNALTDFSESIELQPEFPYNYSWRGATYYGMKEYQNALTDFSKAIELQRENQISYRWRGRAYYQMREYQNALNDFSKAIELQPEYSFSYRWRGRTYYEMDLHEHAIIDFSTAIELQPDAAFNYRWRGITYYWMKDYLKALADFSKAIDLQPGNGFNYRWRAATYYHMREHPKALIDLSKSIEIQPEEGANYYWQGRVYYQIKEYQNALTNLTKAIELNPTDGFICYRYAVCNFALNKKREFKEQIKVAIHYLEATNENKKSWDAKFLQALCYLANNEYEKSQKLYIHLINQYTQKYILNYGLENLKDFINLVGSNDKAKNIEELFNNALSN